ncbi:type II toxin-antitoxin system VapC family toxin [Rhizobium sp. SG2393]|uniref:type II toxin-antitoxin system VapC family toxin n=1 Tax=Rhizobium sp. SG2393 TaxID=3276279 RepID=UPI00366D964C
MSLDAPGPRVYIDTNIFIYLLEDGGDLGGTAEALLSNLRDRSIPIVCSSLVYAECLTGARKRKSAALAEIYRAMFLEDGAPTLLPPTLAILERAAAVSAELGLKLIDAIHVATAVDAACTLFITNDGGIRVPPPLTLCRFSELLDQHAAEWPLA